MFLTFHTSPKEKYLALLEIFDRNIIFRDQRAFINLGTQEIMIYSC